MKTTDYLSQFESNHSITSRRPAAASPTECGNEERDITTATPVADVPVISDLDDTCDVEPSNAEVVIDSAERPSLLELFELILKAPGRLHRLIRDPSLQPEIIPRLLAIALIGFTLFGVSLTFIFQSAGVWPSLTSISVWLDDPRSAIVLFDAAEPAVGGQFFSSALILIVAHAVGLIAATGVVLPSLYFYGLLSGLRMSMLSVTVHALKGQATTAVALVGILPLYLALALGIVVFGVQAPLLSLSLLLGMSLPYIAGLWGVRSLYVGFQGLCDTMPIERRARRACFLRRLVLSWSACYTAITPVMVHTLWSTWSS